MRLELTRVGLLAELANHYTTRGASFAGQDEQSERPDLVDWLVSKYLYDCPNCILQLLLW